MKKELTTKTKVQLGIVAVHIVVIAVFILLNMQTVEVNLLFAKIEMSRSILLLVTFAIGASAGWFLKSWANSKKKRAASLAKT